MKTAVELYEAFLIEIDRYGSPDAQVIDFLHFWNQAVYAFLERELAGFELTNTVSDRLRTLSHRAEFSLNTEGCTAPVRQLDIPENYFRLFGVKGVFRYGSDRGFVQKKGDRFVKTFKKFTADLDGFSHDNRFYRPSIRQPYYQILDNRIHFLYSEELRQAADPYLEKVTLRYLIHPRPLELSDNFAAFNSSPFPVDVNRLILKIAVVLFMGTTQDQRIQLKTIT